MPFAGLGSTGGFDLLSGLKTIGGSVISSFAGGGGKDDAGGGNASNAALARLGFAEERRTAIQMAENAARRGGSRFKAPQEGKPKQDTYQQEIARIYQRALGENSRVREALVEQMKRQNLVGNTAVNSVVSDYELQTRVKPKQIEVG
tara:strand:+ start:31 stop:471 length:441 start_codon:yes stop_codon:yes gene_type:complete